MLGQWKKNPQIAKTSIDSIRKEMKKTSNKDIKEKYSSNNMDIVVDLRETNGHCAIQNIVTRSTGFFSLRKDYLWARIHEAQILFI